MYLLVVVVCVTISRSNNAMCIIGAMPLIVEYVRKKIE